MARLFLEGPFFGAETGVSMYHDGRYFGGSMQSASLAAFIAAGPLQASIQSDGRLHIDGHLLAQIRPAQDLLLGHVRDLYHFAGHQTC